MMRRASLYAAFLCMGLGAQAQNINLGTLKEQFYKGKPIKMSGAISANSVAYDGTGGYGRSALTYYLNGSLNINLYGLVNLPFSYNLTNAGSNYNYPVMPNRLSLHPSYKWISTHVGDVSMTFSPYTLSGHQFRGGGVDLTPDGPWRFSAMYGQLQRAVEYRPEKPAIRPAYERIGYGAKIGYEKEKLRLGMIAFRALDDLNSIHNKPDSLEVKPQENLAMSWNAALKLSKVFRVDAEYALSSLKQDRRVSGSEGTVMYHAFKTGLSAAIDKGLVGLGYERVDPGYQTLGAYYFNNDLENITLSYAQPLFGDKASISLNGGFQHDDLDHSKSAKTKRMIGSVNLNVNPGPKLNTSFSYSNFQTYMNMKHQFDYINKINDLQDIDTLNFVQISQNASANINYTVESNKKRMQTLSVNGSYQTAADKQGEVIRAGSASQFYNLATSYSLMFVPRSLNLTGAFNCSYNTIGRNDFITVGPVVAISCKFFNKKLSTGISSSYNVSTAGKVTQSKVMNVRSNTSLALVKKHNLNLSLINQGRQGRVGSNTHDLTATLGYNYNF